MYHPLMTMASHYVVQSTLGFETLDKAAALGLETATPLTDPRQYINSNLGFRNLKIWLLYSKIAAVVVSKPSGNKNKCAVYRETADGYPRTAVTLLYL